MMPLIRMGITGAIVGLAFLLNGARLVRGPGVHTANTGALHIALAAMFAPTVGVIIVFTKLA